MSNARASSVLALTDRRRRLSGLLLGALVTATLVALPAATLSVPAYAEAAPTVFDTPGGPYAYVVPDGIGEFHVRAVGGTGGEDGGTTAPGGSGAVVDADLPVAAGDTVYVYVGGNGDGPSAGENGGGIGGTPGGGGGGGASDVRTDPADLGSRILVAAGGGGAGYPGQAGGAAGLAGTSWPGCSGKPPQRGTLEGGGSGGTCPVGGPALGGDGSPGAGGDAAPWGGGGGGGYFGGGGGYIGGGAGGSNYIESTPFAHSEALNTTGEAPSVTITPGRLAQSVTFDAVPTGGNVGGSTGVSASADSGLATTITVGDATTDAACSITQSGGVWTVSFDNAGTCELVASAESDTYVPAEASTTFTVTAVPPLVVASGPSIAGTAAVGQVLTADPGTTTPAADSYTYRWLRDDGSGPTAIDGATGSTYTLTAADRDTSITVEVTVTKTGYTDAVAISDPTATVTRGTFTTGPTASITGVARVGATLTATTGTTTPAADGFTYQWRRGDTDIDGQTSSTYDVVALDLGKQVTVTVTATKSGYAGTSDTSAPTDAVAAGVLELSGSVTINGTAQVGQSLTADSTVTTTPAAVLTGQWLRDDGSGATPIDGATDPTYTLVAADYGTSISYRTTARLVGYDDATDTSTEVGPVTLGDFTTGPAASITGTAQVGKTLTAHPGPSTIPAADDYSYQWLRGAGSSASPIDGATDPTYTLTADDLLTTISVQVTASTAGYTDAVDTSAPTGTILAGVFTTGSAPSITGDATVGKPLTVDPGTTTPAADGYTYRWLRDDGTGAAAIDGATGSTYTLTPADLDTSITVEVTASKSGYTDTVAASGPVGPVDKGTFTTGPAPTVTGTARVGYTLTAAPGPPTDPVADDYTYQWLRDDGSGAAPIDGATGSTYTLTPADLGQTIAVRATASSLGYTDADGTSEPTAAVGLGDPVPVDPVEITGTPAVGQTLTAVSTATGDPADGGQWSRDGQPVPDAYDATYRLTAADLDTAIGYRLTVAPPGHAATTVRADRVGPVVPGNFDPGPAPTITGDAVLGQTLTAHPGQIVPTPTQVGYQWYADDTAIPGATGTTLEITEDLLGTVISVAVTAARAGYDDASATSDPFGPVTTGQPPTLILNAADHHLRRGQDTVLTWTSQEATSLTATGDWPTQPGPLPASGSVTIHPTGLGAHTYRLEATNAEGTTAVQVTVRVWREPLHLDVRAPRAGRRGLDVQVRTSGLDPHEPFRIRFGKDLVARGRADAHGRVVRQITVPVHAHLGRTSVKIIGSTRDRVGHTIVRVRRSHR